MPEDNIMFVECDNCGKVWDEYPETPGAGICPCCGGEGDEYVDDNGWIEDFDEDELEDFEGAEI